MKKNKQLKSAMKKQPATATSQQNKTNAKRPAEQQAHFKDRHKKNSPFTHTAKKAKLDTTSSPAPKKSVKIVDHKTNTKQANNGSKSASKSKVKKAEVVPENATLEDFRIVTGTYQNVLYGIDAYWNEDKTLKMKPIFAFSAHIGCIKTLAIGGTNLASGSTDEKIQLYDLKRRKELGALMQHTGTITTLAFHSKTHMLSGSDDGKICVWRSKDWECLKVMKGHQSTVHSIAIHPTGKLALSVSSDKTMRLWNLLLGKQASQNKLTQEGIKVAWNPSGNGYSIMFDYEISIYDMATAKPVRTVKPAKKTRFNTMAYYKDEYLVTGCEDKTIKIYRVADGELVKTLTGHQQRIKDVGLLMDIPVTPNQSSNTDASDVETMDLLVSASSDGFVRVWNVEEAVKGGDALLQPLGEHNTEMRVTCLATQPGIWKNINVNSGVAVEEEEEEEDDEEYERDDVEQDSDEEDEEDIEDEDEDEEDEE